MLKFANILLIIFLNIKYLTGIPFFLHTSIIIHQK
jgi:hypothetical protein